MKEKLVEIKKLIDELLSELIDDDKNDNFESQSDSSFEFLKSLLDSPDWPKAVLDEQIADENSEKDKDERAEGVVDMLLPPLDGKKFLDFGCGEGHVVNYASQFSSFSAGYDLVRHSRSRFEWEVENEKTILTTEISKIALKGPYDVILLYDVMDHIQESNPQEILTLVKSLLADDGKVYMRTHPWCSRHGGHVYKKINKAFVHLVFTEEELRGMGIEVEHNLKTFYPLSSHKLWLNGSGLKKSIEPELDQHDVESFFKENPIIKSRILNAFGRENREWTLDCPEWQMSQCFWDYVLEKE